jgi:hypothetical protein
LPASRRRRLLDGLNEAGRTLAEDMVRCYGNWTPRDLVHLREAAIDADILATIRAAITAEGGPAKCPARLLRAEHQAAGRLLKSLAALNLEGGTRG